MYRREIEKQEESRRKDYERVRKLVDRLVSQNTAISSTNAVVNLEIERKQQGSALLMTPPNASR